MNREIDDMKGINSVCHVGGILSYRVLGAIDYRLRDFCRIFSTFSQREIIGIYRERNLT